MTLLIYLSLCHVSLSLMEPTSIRLPLFPSTCPDPKSYWQSVKKFCSTAWNIIKSSKYIEIWCCFLGISLLFYLLHFGVVTGSVLIQHCKGILSIIILLGLFQIFWTIGYLVWLCLQEHEQSSPKNDVRHKLDPKPI